MITLEKLKIGEFYIKQMLILKSEKEDLKSLMSSTSSKGTRCGVLMMIENKEKEIVRLEEELDKLYL